MIILWPLLLLGAALIMAKARARGAPVRGWDFFAIWGLAGALYTFSFLSGYSIGLFLFPVAALAVLWLAVNAPGREALGFVAGAVATLLIVLVFV